jgi:uncharacterized protein (DUF433 family)
MGKRKISVDVAIKDVRSGMSDAELMEKYRLSAKGLQSLCRKLLSAGLIGLEELDQRMPTFMGTVFVTNEIRPQELLLQDVSTGIPPERQPNPPISFDSVVTDIRAGATDPTLMTKYGLSSRGLQSLLEHLVFSGVMTQIEADQRMASLDSTIDLHGLRKRSEDESAIGPPDQGTPAGWECPACGRPQPRAVNECPVCGVIVAKFMKKMAREKEPTS